MPDLYCTVPDLYAHGLPRGDLAEPARVVASVSLPSTVRLADHGYATNDVVRATALPGGTLPTGLAEATNYYAIRVDADRLQLAATSGGSALPLGTSGTNWGLYAPNDSVALACIEYVSRLIDHRLPAHVVPLTAPLPLLVVGIAAKLAIRELMARLRRVSAAGPDGVPIVEAQAQRADLELDRLAKAFPLRDTRATASANLSSSWGGPDRGWGSTDEDVGGTLP